ncbi:MAG: BsuBI/PstI family type II restriction endonuclease, partial [Cyclobacteriaceae bacterium]
MKKYILKSAKPRATQKAINEALEILELVGIPVDKKSQRALEKMAMAFLAVAGVTNDWSQTKSSKDEYFLKTRDIIIYINKHFKEKISPGSYDDIRRKDLKLLVIADLVVNSGKNSGAATNNPTRGYALLPEFAEAIKYYGTSSWSKKLKLFNQKKEKLSEILLRKRSLEKIPVTLPGGKAIDLSLGEHNILQKKIIEEFLPIYGKNCEVLYIGDTSNKLLHIEEEELKKLNFFKLSHEELPDVIAYNRKKNWLYLIEAYYSTGPMSELRVIELRKLLKKCKAEPIFVTAFLTKGDFKKIAADIAWETE